MKTETQTTIIFEIGSLATRIMYSDRIGGRIIEVKDNGNCVVFQEDEVILLNGVHSGEPDALQFSRGGFIGHTSGTQRWELKPNPNGKTIQYSRRKLKDGTEIFVCVGERTRNGEQLILGHHHHYDFNF